jgi:NAD+ synthase
MNCEKEVQGLVKFIQDQVLDAGRTGCVVGVSGGIDSAVIAALCKLAFPETTYGISMPRKLSLETTERAKELCKKLNIYLVNDPIVANFDINDDCGYKNNPLAEGNYCARIRMTKLYYHAEQVKALVIGTDNKSENFIGFFTKFADGGVDNNPIGEYFKSEVFELGKYLEVPESILNAVPTAELWDNQTDEGELGMTYDEMEKTIRYMENLDFFNDMNEENGLRQLNERQKEVYFKVKYLHSITHHKRCMPPEYHRNSIGNVKMLDLNKEKVEEILNYRFESVDLRKTLSIKDFLKKLLITLFEEKECFDGKKPFGNSGWEYDIYKALVLGGVIQGEIDSDGYVKNINEEEADKLTLELINFL